MAKRDYYEVLGLKKGASEQEMSAPPECIRNGAEDCPNER